MITKILSQLTTESWAMQESSLRAMVENIKAGLTFAGGMDKPVETKNFSSILGQQVRMQDSSLTVFNNSGVATVMIDTMILPRSDMFTDWMGLVTVEGFSAAIEELDRNEMVETIVLAIDSPGGMTTNIDQAIEALRNCQTPVYSYAYGTMASLAYWIGSATKGIYAAPTSKIGSIGTLAQMQKDDDETITIVSNLSPDKNADPETSKGRAQIMAILDGITTLFHKSVALSRGVTQEHVAQNYGKGAIFIAETAQNMGMIDGIALTIDNFIKNIDGIGKINNISNSNNTTNTTNKVEGLMAEQRLEPTAAVEEVVEETTPVVEETAPVEETVPATETVDPLAAERLRIQSIEGLSSNFDKAPSNVKASIQKVIDTKKYEAEATAESVSAEIVAGMNSFYETAETDTLASGREMAAAASTLPTGDAINNAVDSEAAVAKAQQDSAIAGMTAGMK